MAGDLWGEKLSKKGEGRKQWYEVEPLVDGDLMV